MIMSLKQWEINLEPRIKLNDNISTGRKKLFFEESMVLNIFKTTSLCWELVLLRFKSKITTMQLHL